jgi:hypothetical protein
LEVRRQKHQVMARAIDEFHRTRGLAPMGAHVLRIDGDEAIVRVMYMTDHIPPARAWFAVPKTGAAVRELSFEDVASLETPWR